MNPIIIFIIGIAIGWIFNFLRSLNLSQELLQMLNDSKKNNERAQNLNEDTIRRAKEIKKILDDDKRDNGPLSPESFLKIAGLIYFTEEEE